MMQAYLQSAADCSLRAIWTLAFVTHPWEFDFHGTLTQPDLPKEITRHVDA